MTLKEEIINGLQEEAYKYINLNKSNVKTRAYECSVNKCTRSAYAKGFCNAHYIRNLKGLPLDTPLRNRTKNLHCIECGIKTTGKGGFGRCRTHYKSRRRWVIKEILINALGGKCQSCNESFNQCVYDFHHIDKETKKHSVAKLIANGSFDEIDKELSKCILLCANCHREVHNDKVQEKNN